LPNKKLCDLLNKFLEWNYHDVYGWVCAEKDTWISYKKKSLNYKGVEEWKTQKEGVKLKNALWNTLWNTTYVELGTGGSKIRRVKYCINSFPESLYEMQKVLRREFQICFESLPEGEIED